MANQFLICYCSTVVFCAICILYLAHRMNRDIGNDAEIKALYFMTFWEMALAASQIIWVISTVYPYILNRALLNLINFGDMFGTIAIAYSMFRFIEPQLMPMEEMRKKSYRHFSMIVEIPLITMLLLDLTTDFTHWIYYVDSLNHYHRGPYYNIQFGVCFFYVFAMIGLMIRQRKTIEREKQLPVLLFYMFIPATGMILQVISGAAPFGVMSIVLGTLVLFIYMQSKRIYTDLLTGLNNHGRAMSYLSERLDNAFKKPFYLYMCDIDHFKAINDHNGHVNGDLALVCVSQALKELSHHYQGLFISRFGGDEFMLVLNDVEINPDEVESVFRQYLEKMIQKENLSFKIEVSMGYTYVERPIPLTDVINEADVNLYDSKRANESS